MIASIKKMTAAEVDALIERASAAGWTAGTQVIPQPMHVVGYAPIADGVCGFAWVNVKPGNGQVAKRLVALGLARRDSYAGGVTVWISEYNQSMTRKEAHARAFAKVLQEAGVKAYAGSRID